MFSNFNERGVGILHLENASRSRHIETQTELNNCPNNGRCLDFRAAFCSFYLFGELQTPLRVGFPKIDTWAEPIIIIVANSKVLAGKKALGNVLVTTVITKDE